MKQTLKNIWGLIARWPKCANCSNRFEDENYNFAIVADLDSTICKECLDKPDKLCERLITYNLLIDGYKHDYIKTIKEKIINYKQEIQNVP